MIARRALGNVLIAALLAGAVPASAQTAADLFDVNTIQEIRLSVNSRDLRTLRERFAENAYYTADLTWRNIRVRNVGIRSRGLGSRNGTKLGLRVDMAHYTTGQTLVGLSTIVLDNLWQDDAMIRERLAFTMFERLGVPAPRESFCRLYINNEYQGLYAVTEEIDGDFARRVTGETDGTMFEYHYVREWRFEDLGDISAYKPLFEPRTHRLDADGALYTPIQNLIREVNGPDDAVWRERVEQYIDLNQFVTHAAVESFIAENDGLLGYAGMNNFYLYRQQGTSKHRLFPWDKDNAFLFIDGPVATTDANVLFRRAMGHADLREVYLSTVEQAARIAAADGFLAAEIERLAAQIFDAARADTRKQFSNERFDEAVEFMRQFAARRPALVLDEVARIRRSGF
ncbi:MAG TPA: CotH kinase family protein [Vicinamibacterales bacterium]|nr:CotH kinase family protein [Vicinamibacterales bacterium]